MFGITRPRLMRGASLPVPVEAPVIHTERLTLRPFSMADSDRWFEIQSDPQVRAFTSWPERNREESRRHLKNRTHHVLLKQADDFLALAVEHDGILIGDVSLHLRSVETVTRSAEISWILHPDSQGHGYAFEAARAMLELAFTRLEARVIFALVHPTNTASMALAQKLGFTPFDGSDGEIIFVSTGLLAQ
ncbi:GNAT family N-acetyltransferase [Salinibacterium sp. SWN139]|uniref:GNAT family N-acetyltransferase n=1 Tax=Salinibacterium sp. SWN139 TaxID=2792055 RepID=UPI0018CE8C1A|nr:GNAT family N-acetyltransferase [Salinibacterium sp. SWN139]MBH0055010.1 GNAT family N-acetyltransferase [Salinibacterium sp. SWN139]